ncbi:MAG TPA: hypothetical protein VKB88_21710 [Bryobacteraceae bacterium]|nr:hypothetical protein [Bryobacteraceae bacterium]
MLAADTDHVLIQMPAKAFMADMTFMETGRLDLGPPGVVSIKGVSSTTDIDRRISPAGADVNISANASDTQPSVYSEANGVRLIFFPSRS